MNWLWRTQSILYDHSRKRNSTSKKKKKVFTRQKLQKSSRLVIKIWSASFVGFLILSLYCQFTFQLQLSQSCPGLKPMAYQYQQPMSDVYLEPRICVIISLLLYVLFQVHRGSHMATGQWLIVYYLIYPIVITKFYFSLLHNSSPTLRHVLPCTLIFKRLLLIVHFKTGHFLIIGSSSFLWFVITT